MSERWEVTQFGASWAVHPVGADGERWDICRVHPENYHPDGWEAAKAEAEHRARLIASAPEMADRLAEAQAEVERLRASRAEDHRALKACAEVMTVVYSLRKDGPGKQAYEMARARLRATLNEEA